MVRASNPKLMVRVLDAVANLGDSRGSSAREVLSFIRMSNVSSKNLTVQVHRALKNAVNAGLLRHKSGRYKVLATLNPASDSLAPPAGKEPAGGGQKTDNKTSKPDAPSSAAPIGGTKSPRRKQERKKRTTSQRQSGKSRSSGTGRRTRRSPHKRANATGQTRKRRQRKRSYELEDQSSGRYVSTYDRDAESFSRRTKRPRLPRRESDSSDDESDRESYVSRKRVSRAGKSSRREKPSASTTRARSRDRSASRARSPQRNVQYPIKEAGNDDRRQRDEDRGSAERDAARQEAREEGDVEGCAREPNDSNSGSTLENS